MHRTNGHSRYLLHLRYRCRFRTWIALFVALPLSILFCGWVQEVNAWALIPAVAPLPKNYVKKSVSFTQQVLPIPIDPQFSPFGSVRSSPYQQRQSKMTLSNSVLASCDTLPSFSTAHGLLSPETVMKLEEGIQFHHRSPALVQFLDTYKAHGPLSCIPMLSDPDVLPYLTSAMRDIAL